MVHGHLLLAVEPDDDAIHQSLLAGLLSHIGALEERDRKDRGPREYLGARGSRFAIFPGSVLKGRNPGFLMSAELVETSRLWARQNAAINPEWAERLGAHLVKRTYSEPHWSRKRAAVMARERVTLYGVPLAADRLVQYGRIDPAMSREMFIRHALVYGEWTTHQPFYRENLRLLEEAEELSDRLAIMHRGLVAAEGTVADVVAGHRSEIRWKADAGRPEVADLSPGDTVQHHGRYVVVRTNHLQRSLSRVLAWADDQALALSELKATPASLETAFLELAGTHVTEEAA